MGVQSEYNLLIKTIVKLLCVMLAVLALAAGTEAQTYAVLKHFNPNTNVTGLHAKGTLVQGPDGSLYGVATDGGTGAAPNPPPWTRGRESRVAAGRGPASAPQPQGVVL